VAHLAEGFRVGLRTETTTLPAGQGPRHRRELLAFLATVGPDGEGDERDDREAAA
jgi:hypothetical protein